MVSRAVTQLYAGHLVPTPTRPRATAAAAHPRHV